MWYRIIYIYFVCVYVSTYKLCYVFATCSSYYGWKPPMVNKEKMVKCARTHACVG